MSEGKIPHNALIVVADGTGARFFRNSGQENKVSLSADGEFKPTNLLNAGPAGKRPRESSGQETDEATFAKQLANELYRRAKAEASRPLSSSPIHRPWAKSAHHCTKRFRIGW
jgi:protein required for attachment to host cells